jgi:ribosomal protein S18 acetylase RimI-like enzyme
MEIRSEKSNMIRRAIVTDIHDIDRLLYQVNQIHADGRPDLFVGGLKKYTDEELAKIIADDAKPIFVATDEREDVIGYAFCVHQQYVDNNILTDVKTLYIDDLCVDESRRGMHIGRKLYDHVAAYARRCGCYNVTLNVWSLNSGALKFYEKCGLVPQKIGMEKIL